MTLAPDRDLAESAPAARKPWIKPSIILAETDATSAKPNTNYYETHFYTFHAAPTS